jgi:hypothetical protein
VRTSTRSERPGAGSRMGSRVGSWETLSKTLGALLITIIPYKQGGDGEVTQQTNGLFF